MASNTRTTRTGSPATRNVAPERGKAGGPTSDTPSVQSSPEDPNVASPEQDEAATDSREDEGASADVDEQADAPTVTLTVKRGNHVHAGKRLEKGAEIEVAEDVADMLERRGIAARK